MWALWISPDRGDTQRVVQTYTVSYSNLPTPQGTARDFETWVRRSDVNIPVPGGRKTL